MNHQTIIDRITRIHRNKPINEGDIIEWVSECEVDYIQDVDNMIGYSGLRLSVVNKKALLPCNVYRILKVYSDRNYRTSDVNFRKVNQWLHFPSTYNYDYMYIDFFGLRIDESGYPEIPDGHIPALVAFCVHNLYYEDFLQKNIDATRWQFIHQDMVNKLADIGNSMRNMTLEDINSLHYIQYNMVPKIGTMDFIVNDSNSHFIE